MYFHIYNRGTDRKTLFISSKDYTYFIRHVTAYAAQSGVEVLSYCLMPNHFHLLVSCEASDILNKYMHRLQTSFAMYFNKRHGKSGYVFEGRYKSKIVHHVTYLVWLSCYIHYNPIAANLVSKPEHWQYSSYSSYLDKTQNEIRSLLLFEEDVTYTTIFQNYCTYRSNRDGEMRDVLFR